MAATCEHGRSVHAPCNECTILGLDAAARVERAASPDLAEARLRVALDTAADGLRSAAKYLRYVNAFAFAEQVEIDERHARDAGAAYDASRASRDDAPKENDR
jgi:hypothetical protein